TASRRRCRRGTPPYGRRHGLQGVAGMVADWTAYRAVTDAAFADLALPKLAIETTPGDWPTYRQQVLAFLDLPPAAMPRLAAEEAARLVGTYRSAGGDTPSPITVRLAERDLVLDGMPHVWPHTRLVPTAPNTFAVEGLPFQVTF